MKIEELIDRLVSAVVADGELTNRELLHIASLLAKVERLEGENKQLRESIGQHE